MCIWHAQRGIEASARRYSPAHRAPRDRPSSLSCPSFRVDPAHRVDLKHEQWNYEVVHIPENTCNSLLAIKWQAQFRLPSKKNIY